MEQLPEFLIERLAFEEDRPAHIARHGVTVDDVLEVLAGDYIAVQAKHRRYLVIGATEQGRFLAIVVGERAEPGTYGLITARPAHRTERALYDKALKGGEHDD
jgi:uncharacterized DUF497 family protein